VERFVVRPHRRDALRQFTRGDGTEGRVDLAVAHRGDRGRGVEQRQDLQRDLRVRGVEVPQQGCGAEAPADDVDAERAGADRGERSRFGPEQFAGVRQESLALAGEPGAASGAREQARAQRLLQRRDPFRDGLLRDGEVGRGVLEPAGVRGGDEGAHGFEIHDDRL
jgi:hypothetical protein